MYLYLVVDSLGKTHSVRAEYSAQSQNGFVNFINRNSPNQNYVASFFQPVLVMEVCKISWH